jgi:hypothetical protein
MSQVVEHLPSKSEALSSTPVLRERKREREREICKIIKKCPPYTIYDFRKFFREITFYFCYFYFIFVILFY